MKINKLLLSVLLVSGVVYAKDKRVLSDEEKLAYSFANVEKKEIIIIKGKDLNDLLKSVNIAMVKISDEEQKDLIKSIKLIIEEEIKNEQARLISRKLTSKDIDEIKFNALNGKTVLDIIGEGKKIEEKRKEEKMKKK